MKWIPTEVETFIDRFQLYWPGKLFPPQAKDPKPLLELWIGELQVYPLSVVLQAMREIHSTSEVNRAPSIHALKQKAGGLHYRQSGKAAAKSGSGPLNRLIEIATENAHVVWTSSKGVKFQITKDGLSRTDSSSRESIPWGNLKPEDLAIILRNNESDIKIIPPQHIDLPKLKPRIKLFEDKQGNPIEFSREIPLKDPAPEKDPLEKLESEYYDEDDLPF